jgi:hypothetical protein
MELVYSKQAQIIMKNPEFDKQEFEQWMKEKGYPIGSTTVMEFLLEKERRKGG